MDPHPIIGAMFSLVPERHHDKILIIIRRISKVLPGWALATLAGMVAVGLIFSTCRQYAETVNLGNAALNKKAKQENG